MTFKDFKDLDYPDSLPLVWVLSDLMFKGDLSFNRVSECYVSALERERHINDSLFNESVINLTQLLGSNFKGKDREQAEKRAIHTYNLNRTLVPHVHDKEYGYTEEDEKEWDEFFERTYGIDVKDIKK